MTETSQMDSRFRELTGFARLLHRILGIAVPLIGVLFILDVPYLLTSVSLFNQQYLGLFLGLVLAEIFLLVPSGRGTSRRAVPWYDWLLAAIGLSGGLYVALFYEQLLLSLGLLTPFKICLGTLFIVTLFEAIRRLVGWTLLLTIITFVFYGRFGYLLPGVLASREISWARLINQLYLDSEFLFGTPLQVAGLVVFSFILFGQFLLATGGSDFLRNLAQSLMGQYRGGPAKISILSSAFFGTLSGTAVGNVAAVGIITIPLMKRAGYSPQFAAAVEAVASTGGCILPPVMGAAAFVMAEFLGVPYRDVVVVSIVPALLYFFALYIQVDLRAAKNKLKGLDKTQIPSLRQTLYQGWQFLIPVFVLLYTLFGWHKRAEVAALYALATLLILALFRSSSRASLKKIPQILEAVTRGMMEVAVVCAGAGLVVGVVNYTGLGQSFSRYLTMLGGGNLLLLALLTAVASTIFGMGLPVTASYLFLAVLVAPVTCPHERVHPLC